MTMRSKRRQKNPPESYTCAACGGTFAKVWSTTTNIPASAANDCQLAADVLSRAASIDARVERLLELLERAKLYVESVEVQPSFGDGSRHLESDAAKDLRIAIDNESKRMAGVRGADDTRSGRTGHDVS